MKSAEQNYVSSIEPTDIDFQQYWFIVKRRWLPATGAFGLVLILSGLGALLQKPVYQAEGKILFKSDETPVLTGLKTEARNFTPLMQQGNPLKTESEVILSKPLLRKTIDTINIKDERGNLVSEELVKSQLEVKNVSGTDVLQITYNSTNPEEAAVVVNQLMIVYLENNTSINRSEAVAARKFIARELPATEAAVSRAETALRRFKEENQVVVLDQEAKSAVEAVAGLDKQITEAQASLAGINAQSVALRKKVGLSSQQATNVSSLSQSPAVQEALKELQLVEGRLAIGRTRYQEAHPVVADLKRREVSLKTLLERRIGQVLEGQKQPSSKNLQVGELKQRLTSELVNSEVERLGLANQIATLSNKQSTYKLRLNVLPRLEQDQRELQRRLEAAQATYENLLNKLQEVQVAENQNIGNARIIEPAVVPTIPSTSKKIIAIVLGGVLLGVLFAGATIVFLEMRDRSIKTAKEARELFGYTLLGAIPLFRTFQKSIPRDLDPEQYALKIPVRDSPRSPISELYRMLQANLRFLSSDKELKVIAVTSSVPQEGKSTVSANLAAAMAQLGRRVLLVDADMRHPSQHHIWELTNEVGLSNVIVGQAELKMAVKEVMPNLNVLTAGVTPPNPVALLDSERMASLIEHFSENYDFVIIDTPPLVLAADALILGKMTDGTLLVTRPGIVDISSATSARESLERTQLNVLGLVVNGVIPENESDSYFYYAKEYYAEYASEMRGKSHV